MVKWKWWTTDLGYISAVWRGPSHPGVGSEANLVVDNDVDRPVSGVVGKVGEVKGLVDHTLSGECSIAMEKDTHNSVTCVCGGGGNIGGN